MQLLNTNSTSYTKIKELGEGSFGEVFLVENMKTNQLVVSKEMRLHGLDEPTVIQLYTEVKVLETIKHPNIIEMYETYRTKSNKLVLILEYASKGDLAHYIKNCDGQFIDENIIRLWIIQLCLALKHSHDHKVVHRDIKTSNVFLDAQNNIKLGDFGLAKNLTCSRQNSQGMAGTPLYLSPEAITKGSCSFKGDVWSLGVVLFELCALSNPFMATNYGNLIHKICNAHIPALPNIYSPELQEFIMKLLERDDKKRPTIGELFETDFIQNILMKNKNEFKKLISATTLSNLELNEKGMKKDFAMMKVYRFSEYKDPNTMIQNIKNIVKKEEKISKFKSNRISVSRSQSDEESDEYEENESHIIHESTLTTGVKINIFEPINQCEHNSQIIAHDSSDDLITLSQLKHQKENFRVGDANLLSVDETADKNLLGYFGNNGNQLTSFYTSIMKSINDRDTKNSRDMKTTFDSEIRNSRMFLENNKKLLDSLFDNNSNNANSVKNRRTFNDCNDKETNRSYIKNDHDNEEIELDDGESHASARISYNYSCSRNRDSERNSRMLATYDSEYKKSEQSSPKSTTSCKRNDGNGFKGKKSVFIKYKDVDLLQSPLQNKFKISTPDRNKQKNTNRTKQQSAEFNAESRHPINIAGTPVKNTKKAFLLKINSKEVSRFNSEKKESSFKLNIKANKSGVKTAKIIKLNLISLADLPSRSNKKTVLADKQASNIQCNTKCKTITSINNLNSLPSVTKNINSITSNFSDLSKNKEDKASISFNQIDGNIDEYGLEIVNYKNIKKQAKSTVLNPLGFKDIQKIYRKSKINDLKRQKAYFMEKYGNKFNLAYSAIKKFLVHYGLKNIENCLDDEDKILANLEMFTDNDYKHIRNRKSVIGLLKLSILEIKCDLL